MKEASYWCQANRVGLLLVIFFAICFAWYFIHPVAQELHMQMFQLSYFWFQGMDVLSFISGAIQSYIWGYIGVGAWYLVRHV